MTVLNDVSVVSIDDFGKFGIHGMNPLDILRIKGVIFFGRWLGMPFFLWADLACRTVVMYRWFKLDRASKTTAKTMVKSVTLAHSEIKK